MISRVYTRFSIALSLVFLASGFLPRPASAGVLHEEDFEDGDTEYSITATGTTFTFPSFDAAHSGTASLRVNPSGCGASCSDNHRVDLILTFPEPTFVGTIELWALEDSTSGSGWGGKMRVGHDDVWDLDWWGIIGNGDPITGEWQFMSVPVDDVVDSVKIRIWDVTSRSTVWLDDIKILGEPSNVATELTGQTGFLGKCKNLTTGDTTDLVLMRGSTTLNCTEEGLVSSPGDLIYIQTVSATD